MYHRGWGRFCWHGSRRERVEKGGGEEGWKLNPGGGVKIIRHGMKKPPWGRMGVGHTSSGNGFITPGLS